MATRCCRVALVSFQIKKFLVQHFGNRWRQKLADFTGLCYFPFQNGSTLHKLLHFPEINPWIKKSSFEISVPKIWNHNLINCKLFSKLSGHPSVPSMIKQCFHDYFLLESILCILVFFSAFTFCVFRFFYPTKLHRTWWFIGLLELMSHNFFSCRRTQNAINTFSVLSKLMNAFFLPLEVLTWALSSSQWTLKN